MPSHPRPTLALTAATTLTTATLATTTYAEDTAEIRATIAALESAVNAGDPAAALTHFSDNYTHSCDDHADLAADLADAIPVVNNFAFTVTSVAVDGDTALVHGTVTGTLDGEPFEWTEPNHAGDNLGLGFFTKDPDGTWRITGNHSLTEELWFAVQTGHHVNNNHRFLRFAIGDERDDCSVSVESVTVTGPFIGPAPLPLPPDAVWGGFSAIVVPSSPPPVETTYTFHFTYSNGDTEARERSVTNYVETAPQIAAFTVGTTTTLAWTDITGEVPDATHYSLTVTCGENSSTLNDIPLSQRSFTLDGDHRGKNCFAIVSVHTTNHNFANRSLDFVPGSNTDADTDSLPDGWEILHFGDLDTADASSDHDRDGTTAHDEFHWGSDPASPTSHPEITLTATPDGWLVTWNPSPDRRYTLLHRPALTSPPQPLASNLTNTTTSYLDTTHAHTKTSFYAITATATPQ